MRVCEKFKNIVHWFCCEFFVVVVVTGKYGERSDVFGCRRLTKELCSYGF